MLIKPTLIQLKKKNIPSFSKWQSTIKILMKDYKCVDLPHTYTCKIVGFKTKTFHPFYIRVKDFARDFVSDPPSLSYIS